MCANTSNGKFYGGCGHPYACTIAGDPCVVFLKVGVFHVRWLAANNSQNKAVLEPGDNVLGVSMERLQSLRSYSLRKTPITANTDTISGLVENKSKRAKIPQNTSPIRLRDLPNRRSLVGNSDEDNQMGGANSSNKKASNSTGAYEKNGGMSSIASPGCSHRPTSITASNNANSDHCSGNISGRKAVAKRNSGKESFKSESIDKHATCSSPKKSRTQTVKAKRRLLVAAVSPVVPTKETCNPNRKRTSQASQSSSKSSKREQLNSNTMNSTANIGTVGTSQQTEPKVHSWLSGITIPRKFPSIEQPRFTCSAHDFLLKNGFRL
ncbi:unnamed protein product [Trichobilharzia szidati]|nr:unnamed protein product [Trichobilharzia szidati]